jgi:hypothetical protein
MVETVSWVDYASQQHNLLRQLMTSSPLMPSIIDHTTYLCYYYLWSYTHVSKTRYWRLMTSSPLVPCVSHANYKVLQAVSCLATLNNALTYYVVMIKPEDFYSVERIELIHTLNNYKISICMCALSVSVSLQQFQTINMWVDYMRRVIKANGRLLLLFVSSLYAFKKVMLTCVCVCVYVWHRHHHRKVSAL